MIKIRQNEKNDILNTTTVNTPTAIEALSTSFMPTSSRNQATLQSKKNEQLLKNEVPIIEKMCKFVDNKRKNRLYSYDLLRYIFLLITRWLRFFIFNHQQ